MRKNALLTLLFLVFTNLAYSQTNDFDIFYKNGIQFHDLGKYDQAIKSYQKALEIKPKSALILYEISLSYFSKQDYENAIKYSSKVIKLNKEHLLSAYIVNGSCLDMQGKTKESIKLFKKAIKKFDNYLLSYNLALNYYKIHDYKNAKKHVVNAIEFNPNHASSHLILAYVENETNNKVPSLLSLYYFLFLEPNSTRSEEAYTILIDNFTRNVSKDANKPNTINITLSPLNGSEYGSAEFMLSLLTASNMSEENKGKSENQMFTENTTSFFQILGEQMESNRKGVTWDYYIPFFYKLSKSEHINTFCHYISQVRDQKSEYWLEEHPEEVEKFDEWLEEN